MNELEFKRHLKELVHGHHHPEEHDWDPTAAPKRTASHAAKKRAPKKTSKRK